MTEQQYPKVWDEKRVKDLIAHYDAINEDEEAQELEDAKNEVGHSWVLVPNELVREVVALITRRKSK
jgi:hypothetical protein